MFPGINTAYLLLPAIVLIVILNLVFRRRSRALRNPIQRALIELRIGLGFSGAFAILLWFLLPSTPVLSSFGFPDSVQDVQPPERLLKLLQDYNRALVRTTDVVFWFLFVFVWWCLSSIYVFSKAIVEAGDRPSADSGTSEEGKDAGP